MSLATWWYEDPRPLFSPVADLEIRTAEDDPALSVVAGLPEGEAARRHAEGHRAYGAYIGDELAAYGWVATRHASIGELGLEFDLPPGNRYLWDFKTLAPFRGRGIYPHLLATIVERESPPATRLWIIHAPENLPSGAGITRAGFEVVAELSFGGDRRAYLAYAGSLERASAGASLLGVPFAEGALSACWQCGSLDCARDDDGRCPCAVRARR